jgi:predicted DNA-binding transcriptional regulator YafY
MAANPTSRVLALLEILQALPRASAGELSQRLGVTPRTVRRYIVQLQQLGVPVDAERGCDGGYRLRAGYKLPPLMFRADEALGLAVGLRAAAQLGLAELLPAVASTQAKLERVMPRELRRRLADAEHTLAFDFARPHTRGGGQALQDLSAAAHAQQTVQLHYQAGDGRASERAVDVYGLAWRAGAWYAVGHCHLRGGLRSFRLDRVRQVQPLPRSFGRPAGFDVLDWLAHSIAVLPRAHAVQVLLHAPLDDVRPAVPPYLGELAAQDGGTLLRVQADDLDWVARELSRLPCAFTVVAPQALRDALQGHATRLLALAGGAQNPPGVLNQFPT